MQGSFFVDWHMVTWIYNIQVNASSQYIHGLLPTLDLHPGCLSASEIMNFFTRQSVFASFDMAEGDHMKRLLARNICLFFLVLTVATGCGCSSPMGTTGFTDMSSQATSTPGQTTPDPTSGSSTSALVTPEPSSNESTQSTSQDPTEQLDMKMKTSPELEGAEKVIIERDGMKRVVYLALADNPYGVAEGTTLGEYKYEVFLDEQRSGGVALAAPVVRLYLERALSGLPADQARWLLTLPVDLSACRSLEPIVIDRSAKPFIDRPYYIRVSSSEELDVVNILDARQEVVVGEFGVYGLQYVISKTSNESMRIIEGQEMAFLFVIVDFQTEPQPDKDYTFGDRLGTTREPVLAGLTSVRGPMIEHEFDCILTVEGCPVFLMANDRP